MTGPCLVSEDWSGSLEAEQEQPLDPGSELFLLLGLDPSEPWPLSPLDRELQHTALYTATISGQRRHCRQCQNPSAPSPGPEFHKRFVLVRVHVQLSIITTCIKQLVVLKHFLEAGGGREGPIKTRI